MKQFIKAERSKCKIKLAISGPSGSGKTYSSLLMAYGLTKDCSKIAVLDTENGSANLYSHLGKLVKTLNLSNTLYIEEPGVYYLQVKYNQGNHKQKITVF